MLVQDEDFRKLNRKPVIIKGREHAKRIAQTFQIDSIWEDDITNEELKEKLDAIEVPDTINATLNIPYIDHNAGISFLILALAESDDEGNVNIIRRDDFSIWSISRKSDLNRLEFIYLEDARTNDDFDLDHYSEFISQLETYNVNDNVQMLRFVEILDDSRNNDYPDDLNVFFIKKDCKMERMWVRCEDLDEDSLIIATLLNTPYQDFGVKAGDTVKVFPYKLEDSDEWIVICDLNR